MTCRSPYDTDLTDPEWEHLKPLIPVAKPGGRPPIHSRREILNGIFYAVRSGCAWKLLPHDCHRGELSIITSGHGAATGHGRGFTTVSAGRCGRQQVDSRNRVVRSSTA